VRQILGEGAFLIIWLAPLILAKSFADTLDRSPYLFCLGVALVLASATCVLLWSRIRRPGLRRDIIILAVLCMPTWAIGVGLGVNRALDHSPTSSHECRVIGWYREGKSAWCSVSSWRGKTTEKLADTLVESDPPDWSKPFPMLCERGASVNVETRTGALGWEWVVRVRRP
jgi:hypothetical protein